MLESKHYTESFFAGQEGRSYLSAKKIIPIVQQVIRPNSVVDVGCGVGYWLKVWQEDFKIEELLGIEGPYVSPSMLKVSETMVKFQDLKQPVKIDRRFDLAMSLEVAEHLPSSVARTFVQSLTSLSDIVLFSAAIVGQEGTFHINEQPPEYWALLFEEFDYIPVDFVRDKIWNDPDVEWWYQQNVLLYVKQDQLQQFPVLIDVATRTSSKNLLRIHPWIFYYKHKYIEKTRTFLGYLRAKLYPLKKVFFGKK